MLELNHRELAWAAGFFDGEGHFATSRWSGAVIVQADLRPLWRFRDAIGLPCSIRRRKDNNGRLGTKPIYDLRYSGFQNAQQLACMLWPYLCEPKRDQFRRGSLKRREMRGISNGFRTKNQKLSTVEVAQVRDACATGKRSQADIARQYGVSQSLVSKIKLGEKRVRI